MSPNGSGEHDPAKESWHDEYYHLQNIITGYNKDCIAIKNWSVTVAAAAIAGAYVQRTPQLLLLSAAGATCFLFTEAYWRANQRVFIEHVREIENARDKKADHPAPDISLSWQRRWGEETLANDWQHIWESAIRVRTWLPHLIIAGAALALWKWAPPLLKTEVRPCCEGSVECTPLEETRPAAPIPSTEERK